MLFLYSVSTSEVPLSKDVMSGTQCWVMKETTAILGLHDTEWMRNRVVLFEMYVNNVDSKMCVWPSRANNIWASSWWVSSWCHGELPPRLGPGHQQAVVVLGATGCGNIGAQWTWRTVSGIDTIVIQEHLINCHMRCSLANADCAAQCWAVSTSPHVMFTEPDSDSLFRNIHACSLLVVIQSFSQGSSCSSLHKGTDNDFAAGLLPLYLGWLAFGLYLFTCCH